MLKVISQIVFFLSATLLFPQDNDKRNFDEIKPIREMVKLGKFEKALQSLDSILILNPKNIYAIEFKASIYANFEKDFIKAIEYYKKFDELYPNNALVLTNIGKNYCKIDSLDIGKEYIKRAYDIEPYNEYVLLQYAFFVIENKNIDEKIKIYEEAILIGKLKLESNQHVNEESLRDIHNNIGYNQYLKKDFLKSAIVLFQGLEYGNENADHLNNLGNALQRLNYLDFAIYYYDQALKIDPNKQFSLNGKANTYQRMGKIDSSCVYWRKTLENGYRFNPEWKEIWDIEDPVLLISKFCGK
jgi:tetratricopeptide (TPR) repeat protein